MGEDREIKRDREMKGRPYKNRADGSRQIVWRQMYQ